MRGVKPERQYYAIDEHPIVEGDKQGTRRLFGHMLVVNRLKDGVGVEGIVSLYNLELHFDRELDANNLIVKKHCINHGIRFKEF